MSWKCKLGLHDWYTVDSKEESAIDHQVACEIDPLREGEFRPCTSGGRMHYHYSCMRCDAEHAGIDAYRVRRWERMMAVAAKFGFEAIEPKKRRKPQAPLPPPPPPKQPTGGLRELEQRIDRLEAEKDCHDPTDPGWPG